MEAPSNLPDLAQTDQQILKQDLSVVDIKKKATRQVCFFAFIDIIAFLWLCLTGIIVFTMGMGGPGPVPLSLKLAGAIFLLLPFSLLILLFKVIYIYLKGDYVLAIEKTDKYPKIVLIIFVAPQIVPLIFGFIGALFASL